MSVSNAIEQGLTVEKSRINALTAQFAGKNQNQNPIQTQTHKHTNTEKMTNLTFHFGSASEYRPKDDRQNSRFLRGSQVTGKPQERHLFRHGS